MFARIVSLSTPSWIPSYLSISYSFKNLPGQLFDPFSALLVAKETY